MKIKHTPLPWKALRGMTGKYTHFGKIYDQREESLGYCCYQGSRVFSPLSDVLLEEAANAQFIITACNSHYELLEALKEALKWIDAVPDDVQLPTMPGFSRDYVDGLIEKAEEA